MGRFALCAVVALCLNPGVLGTSLGWDNSFDGVLKVWCSHGTAISNIESIYGRYYFDRRFSIKCRYAVPHYYHPECYWTGFINDYDQLIRFTCKSNYYVNGLHSVHQNKPEDRIWRFRCCGVRKFPLENCYLTGWTNYWRGAQHYTVPRGQVIHGMVSLHQNDKTDRRYEYLVCKVGSSNHAVNMTTLPEYLTKDATERQVSQPELPEPMVAENQEDNQVPQQDIQEPMSAYLLEEMEQMLEDY